jgi:hypothetical protein
MAEILTTAGIVTLVVITGSKLVLSIAKRFKKSRCVDSKGREVEVEFGSGSETETETSETPHRHRHRKRHSNKRHSHRNKKN